MKVGELRVACHLQKVLDVDSSSRKGENAVKFRS
jgi:hypothetical protein